MHISGTSRRWPMGTKTHLFLWPDWYNTNTNHVLYQKTIRTQLSRKRSTKKHENNTIRKKFVEEDCEHVKIHFFWHLGGMMSPQGTLWRRDVWPIWHKSHMRRKADVIWCSGVVILDEKVTEYNNFREKCNEILAGASVRRRHRGYRVKVICAFIKNQKHCHSIL